VNVALVNGYEIFTHSKLVLLGQCIMKTAKLSQAYFDEPEGNDPLAIRMENMSKGIVWVNGQSIGRYWSSFLTVNDKPSQSE